MGDLTKGYPGNTAIVEAIFNQAPLDVTLAGQALAEAVFRNNFMPYAKANWQYEGSYCNCGDLSQALTATWVYIKTKRPAALPDPGTCASVSAVDTGKGLITKPLRVFAGPAYGNVRVGRNGALDGRCLFPTHWLCKIGTKYFDPTYSRETTDAHDIVERELTKSNPSMWFSTDGRHLYARNSRLPALQFTDSWQEMDARVWVSSQEWTTKTARTHHARSMNLARVDAALYAFEQRGADALAELMAAFENWGARDPNEALARNVDRCVSRLKSFLGSPVPRNL
jgi:hypothetical protein